MNPVIHHVDMVISQANLSTWNPFKSNPGLHCKLLLNYFMTDVQKRNIFGKTIHLVKADFLKSFTRCDEAFAHFVILCWYTQSLKPNNIKVNNLVLKYEF